MQPTVNNVWFRSNGIGREGGREGGASISLLVANYMSIFLFF